MPPQPLHPYARKAAASKTLLSDPSEVAQLAVLAGDTIEALPPALTRSLSDLKELDAVLNTALVQITTKLGTLLELIDDPEATPAQRLALLKEVADEAAGFKLGGEDKIRVATGTCESILHHSKQLDLITSLMTSLMPQHVLELIPASSTPSGYPHLFPSYGSATAASLYRPRSDFFPPPLPMGPSGMATGITRAAQAQYNQALSTVQRYQQEGPLPTSMSGRGRPSPAARKPPQPVQAPRARTISQSSHIGGTLPPPELSHHQPDSPPLETQAAKQKRRAPPPAPLQTVWDVPPGAEADDGSNVGSPASTAANGGRGNKRPRSTGAPASAGGTNGANSPVGEKPALAAVSRRRQQKKPSPDPRTPTNGSRERSAPGNGRTARRAASLAEPDLIDEALASAADEMPVDGAEAAEPAVEGEAVDAPAPNSTGSNQPDHEGEQLYCTCRRVSFGEMIGCDAEDCKIEWFHLACVGLTDPPRGRWLCPDCSKDERGAAKKRRIG